MIQSIKNFIKELLSRTGEISSKRFWGGGLLLNAMVLSYVTPESGNLINSFLVFGTGLLGLGLGEQKKVLGNDK